jgi:hypothetical protein
MSANDFALSGITEEIWVPAEMMTIVLARLTSCHPHTFIVDQSRLRSSVRIGLSTTGARCVQELLDEMERQPSRSDDPN